MAAKSISDTLKRQVHGKPMRNFRTPSWRWRPNSFHKRAVMRRMRRL